MTSGMKKASTFTRLGLNAPFGARYFMTAYLAATITTSLTYVLMHRLALGAL